MSFLKVFYLVCFGIFIVISFFDLSHSSPSTPELIRFVVYYGVLWYLLLLAVEHCDQWRKNKKDK